jgi:hypothetical protein
VTKFNGFYLQEERLRQSGADDVMVMDAAMARFEGKMGHPFKRHHWWQVVRYEPKWSAKHGLGAIIIMSFYFNYYVLCNF